jgi:hypothetical protein
MEASDMQLARQGRFRQQVSCLRRRFLQEGRLPFSEVLSTQCLAQVLHTIDFRWNDRIFTPLVTLWVFLGQSSAPTNPVAPPWLG